MPSVGKETAALHGGQMEGHPTGGTPLWAWKRLWGLEPNMVPTVTPATVYSHTCAILLFTSGSARKYQGLWPIEEL